jgi:hypothetical protein
MKEICILGILVSDRIREVRNIQAVLSKFGCCIKTRLGINEAIEGINPVSGLILLELSGDPNEFIKLENELLKIEGVKVRKMNFN